MNRAISLDNSQKGYFRITQVTRCDTKKLYHTALLPVQLVHLLEHVVVLQSSAAVMRERLTATRFVSLPYAMPIATLRISCQSSLGNCKNKFDSNVFRNIKKTLFSSIYPTVLKFLLRKCMSTE